MSTSEHIPAISYIAEPALVVGLLAAGCIVNRRKVSELHALHDTPRPDQLSLLGRSVPVPDTAPYRDRLVSRLLAHFPFLMEVWYWLLLYWIYQLARAAQAVSMGQGTRQLSQQHGESLVRLEQALWLDVELPLQRLILSSPALLWFSNKTYAMVHIPATIAFLAAGYRTFPPLAYQRIRRTLALCNCLAFIVFTLWPCMPPRLLPFEQFGFVDTLHTGKAASIWTTNKFQNQLAAMPSLHFGYSFIIGLSLRVYGANAAVRFCGPAYPLLILFVIMATANHYLLDAFGGLAVAVVAYRLNGALLRLRIAEEWGFWLCGIQKPMEQEVFVRLMQDRERGDKAVEESLMRSSPTV